MGLKMVCIVLSLILAISNASAAREFPMLEESATLVECWSALGEIKACSNEIILFFMNGQTDIGADCCNAIGVVTHKCWPAMLSSLGFTAEQGFVLRGYCDYSPPSLAPTPAPAFHFH